MDSSIVSGAAETPHGPFRVLIVDDDATTRTLFTSMVKPMHETVSVAADGFHAWEIVQADRPDLVVVDWQMPGMNGLELCARIRESLGDECFVMLVTARNGAEDLSAALAAGADDYIVKPVTRREFQARVVIAERRVSLARMKRAAVEEAARMRWLAGIGQTVLALQHEINNPLTVLFGSLAELTSRNGLPASLEEDVRVAWEQAERIAETLRQLAALDRPTTVELIAGLPMLSIPR